jgi:phosphoribosyl 1,2-cyclic phosphodiesterase
MKLWLLGVRGSTPAPGSDFVRYGGHTSCVAVVPDDSDAPTVVLDAGSGLRELSARLPRPAYRGAILLSHLHWDHMEGIPFFVAGDQDQSVIDLYLPEQAGMSGRDLLARAMSPPSFPITPEGLHGAWTFNAVAPGRMRVGGFDITSAEVAHKGGRTFGYRIEDDSGAIAYVPDHAPIQGCSDDLRAMIRGVDVLLHDAQFFGSERSTADLYGHATIDEAVRLADESGVRTLVLFHHGPNRTDDELDRVARDVVAPTPVVVAREGSVIEVSARAVVSS